MTDGKAEQAARQARQMREDVPRRVCLAMQVKSREDQQTRRELLKINADLGRLGGLLKQTLASGVDRHLIHTHLREIDRTRDLLKTRVKGMA